MFMAKRLLIVKASNDICTAEVDQLKSIASMFGMNHCVCELKTVEEFKQSLCASADKYDYIYVAAHADLMGFGTQDRAVNINWSEFAAALCETNCLNPECILLLGCCRGGLKQVAFTLFLSCDQIDYICGPRWTVTSADLTAGFHVFVYNMEVRKEQPSTAVDRASKATNYDFFCYDRVEVEDEIERLLAKTASNPRSS